jgi:fibronectin-binding autotransporter adhesin
MPGSNNKIQFANGYRLEPSAAEEWQLMQDSPNTDDVSCINNAGSPEGVVPANPGSICHDHTNGNIYLKKTGTNVTGWQQIASGTGIATTYTTDSGVATPSGNNLNVLGSGSITTSGAGSTLSTSLTGLTNHAVLVGAGTSTITKVGPTATAGQVLQSAGAAADPAFSTATYPSTTTVSQILYSSATNVVSGLATANNSILSTNGSGVPSLGTSLSNDYTFTKATSGATTTLTVSNTSNTASSAANILAQVAGGTAADATYQSTISGGQAWTWGLDNSDSDAFALAGSATLGSTNVMRVSTAGEINFPLQPAFLAYVNTAIPNVVGDATVYTIIFDTEVYDQNGDFNLGTSTFTAPVTGKYHFDFGVLITGGTSISAMNGQIVTTALTYQKGGFSSVTLTTAALIHSTVTVPMTAGDTATFAIVSTDSGGKVDDVAGVTGSNPRTWVNGWLVA